jgi:RHS repeat-associated protein
MYFDAFESRRQTYIGAFPGGLVSTSVVYDYDPLYRLTAADYNGGTTYFHYTYDAVGNRQTEVTQAGTTTYAYDIANRLTSVNGVPYIWSNNGNLLNDGASTYTYDHGNRLATVTQASNNFSFGYNGLGDRLRQTVNGSPTNYNVDLTAGLTQVLTDGTTSYLYGLGRIGEEQPGGWQYHLGDALGSVRQLTNPGGAVTLARSYEPFGDTLASAGAAATAFQYTGEARDGTGLTYLRARYYASAVGRFASRDLWAGARSRAIVHNLFAYADANPLRYVDRTGLSPVESLTVGVISRFDQSSARTLGVVNTWTVGPLPPSAVLRRLWPGAYCPGGPDELIEEYELLAILEELRTYGLIPKEGEGGTWTLDNAGTVLDGVARVAGRLYTALPSEILSSEARYSWRSLSKDVFRTFFSGLAVVRMPYGESSGHYAESHSDGMSIDLRGPAEIWTTDQRYGMTLVGHELGHIFSYRHENEPSNWVQDVTRNATIADAPGKCALDPAKDPDQTKKEAIDACSNWHDGLPLVRWSEVNAYELWADVFAAWAFGAFHAGPRPRISQSRGAFWRGEASEYMRELVAAEYSW